MVMSSLLVVDVHGGWSSSGLVGRRRGRGAGCWIGRPTSVLAGGGGAVQGPRPDYLQRRARGGARGDGGK